MGHMPSPAPFTGAEEVSAGSLKPTPQVPLLKLGGGSLQEKKSGGWTQNGPHGSDQIQPKSSMYGHVSLNDADMW
jgi:hypothetical protein